MPGFQQMMKWFLASVVCACACGLAMSVAAAGAETPAVTFGASPGTVEVYDFAEVAITVKDPTAANPFTDVAIVGEFGRQNDKLTRVDGFCDAADGSVFRVRFMPSKPGRYHYTIRFDQGGNESSHKGSFTAVASKRKGRLRIDPRRPEHFVWEGTGEHYFWNGTTTYYLMGWDDETIRKSIDRLAGYRINRLRVLLYGRNHPRPWDQPVVSTQNFKLHLNPWPAEKPDDIAKPNFDLSRFNVDHWQKYERLLRYAREKDVIVSVIFFIGGQVLPTPFAAGSADEDLYYRYGVARLAAFSNITWDLGNEYNIDRPIPWADRMGTKVKQWDPYLLLCSAHNITHRTPSSSWCDMQLIQDWSERQNAVMLRQRQAQRETGRIIPQINEEYGYEDLWEKKPGQRSAATRRQYAWEIAMAGCYQTTGESTRTGTGIEKNTGGGWINGRGDDSMVMLRDYRHLADFFTAFDWWNCQPSNDLIEQQFPCLAIESERYVVYMAHGGRATIKLSEGKYQARWFNPRTGDFSDAGVAVAPTWTSDNTPDASDWVLLLTRDDTAIDRLPPRLLKALATGEQQIDLTFSEPLEQSTACDPANYTLNHDIQVRQARWLGDAGQSVRLTTSELAHDVQYTLSVRNVRDRAEQPNIIRTGEQAQFIRRDPRRPLVALVFSQGQGLAAANTGDASTTHSVATLTPESPRWSNNSPRNGDGNSLDFGTKAGEFAVDLGIDAPEMMRNLKSFTITGWLNCRSLQVGPGGNRIVHMADTLGTRSGFDLVITEDGQLKLGVNGFPDGSPAHSRRNAVTADPKTGQDNWRFFAVTYDATATSDNAKFYFGDGQHAAKLDRTVTYLQGPLGPRTGPLTIGAFNPTTRTGNGDRAFQGLIDDVRIYGSIVDGEGALTRKQILAIQ